MKRVLSLTIFLYMFTLTLCGAAIASGQRLAPADVRARGMGMCEGMPCLAGVVPGQTRWQDAQALLSTANGSEVSQKRIGFAVPPGGTAELYPSMDGISVGRIYLRFADHAPLDVGWIVEMFGEPCGVSLYREDNMFTLRYPLLLANVQLPGPYLHTRARVTLIQFSDPAYHSDVQPTLCVDNVTGQGTANRYWIGFTTLGRYMESRRWSD